SWRKAASCRRAARCSQPVSPLWQCRLCTSTSARRRPSRARRRLRGMSRYASVYPLVTTRALARPFTYEVPEEVDRGAVVSVRLGGGRKRGVVVGVDEAPPTGVDVAPIERVVETLPRALVELALWVADYYGSTPGRALALIAPVKRERRKELPQPAERESLPGEAEPAALTAAQERALARIRGAFEEGGGHLLLYGATGSGKTEVYLQAAA